MQSKVQRACFSPKERYQCIDIPIWKLATAGHFEGGDFVILEPRKVLIGHCGERPEPAGSEQIAAFVRDE